MYISAIRRNKKLFYVFIRKLAIDLFSKVIPISLFKATSPDSKQTAHIPIIGII